VVVAAVCAVVINALFMQVGPHPAPMFKTTAAPTPATNSANGTTAAVGGRIRTGEPNTGKADPARASLRSTAEIVADIQRELARRGFFDGVVDGRRGPRTEVAIRDFEVAAGMMPNPDPTEDLLAAIRRSNVKGPRTAVGTTTSATAPHAAPRNDPIAAVLGRR
jgi:peptidoglycan hydrolase-like protein with peptidoglycan-binding domain